MSLPSVRIFAPFMLLFAAALAQAADWPQHRHDANRSNVSPEKLTFPLRAAWTYHPAQAPRPAWPEPGKELHRIDFDYAPQVAVADGQVVFGSTADDSLRALDLTSGKMRWRFTTEGPVRFAPAIEDGRVYAASDDGYLYCVTAGKGKMSWRFQAAPRGDRLIGNGRMISRWPLRSGVLLRDGVVHTVAGMWPDEGVHVCALEAATGQVVWRNDSSGAIYTELPHPAASGFSGVAPQGALSACADALLAPTGRGIPAIYDRKSGDLMRYNPGDLSLVKHGGAWTCVSDDLYFTRSNEKAGRSLEAHTGEVPPVSGNGITCFEIASGKELFTLQNTTEIVAAGDRLYAAGGDHLAAYDFAALRKGASPEKAQLWTVAHSRIYCLALAGDALLVGGADTIETYDAKTGEPLWKSAVAGQIRGLAVADGRIITSTNKGVITCFAPNGSGSVIRETITETPVADEMNQTARQIIERSGKNAGYALVLGDQGAAMAQALIRNSDLHVIHPSANDIQARKEREQAIAAGVYGTRLAVPLQNKEEALSFAPYFADLIVIAGQPSDLAAPDIYRCLRPCGGTLVFARAEAADVERLLKEAQVPADSVRRDDPDFTSVVRGALPGAGEWRRAKADPGNTLANNDSRVKMPLEVLWFGGPGPDRMLDRHFSPSPPLSVNGRVFVTGERDLIAFDAYNGRELWDVKREQIARSEAHRSSGNLVADDTSLYLASGVECLRFDQASGKTLHTFKIPSEIAAEKTQWGYVELLDDLLIGSVAKGEVNSHLFALNINDGSLKWQYAAKAAFPGLAVAMGEGRIYLLEIPDISGAQKRRGNNGASPELVALDAVTGEELWRKGVANPATPVVQFAQGIVVLNAVAGFDAATGKQLWRNDNTGTKLPVIQGEWIISQPYAYSLKTGKQRKIVDPVTNQERPWELIKAYGCGATSGSESMLFFRSGSSAFYDSETDGTANFGGIKPNCGISMIAAGGLVQLPESNSGCSCSYNYQTSLALVPAEDRQREQWFVLGGQQADKPLKTLRLNLGAPGDRKDKEGNPWLAYPRPILKGAVPVALKVSAKKAEYYRHPRMDRLPVDKSAWLYANGLINPEKLTLNLYRTRPLDIIQLKNPMTIDGKLDRDIFSEASAYQMDLIKYRAPAPVDLRDFHSNLFLASDAEALYLAVQSPSPQLTEKRADWAAKTRGEDARVWEDDSWEIFLTDTKQAATAHLGVSASGARFDALWQKNQPWPDVKWNGKWTSAVATDDKEMVAELAIPWSTIDAAGIARDQIRFNAIGTGPCGLGAPEFGLPHDRYSVRWSGMLNVEKADTYTFTIRANDFNNLWIDGKQVVKAEGEWTGFPSVIDPLPENNATVKLDAGRHAIKIEYGERSGTSECHLFWSTPSMPKTIVPASVFLTEDGKPGLKAEIYGNPFFGLLKGAKGPSPEPLLTRIDSQVDFAWGPMGWRSELVPNGEVRSGLSEVFVPLGTARVKAPSPNQYKVTLHFAELDGIRPGDRVFDILLNGKKVLENFDICAEAGCNTPLEKAFRGVSAPRDQITIEMLPPLSVNGKVITEGPIISAIQVMRE